MNVTNKNIDRKFLTILSFHVGSLFLLYAFTNFEWLNNYVYFVSKKLLIAPIFMAIIFKLGTLVPALKNKLANFEKRFSHPLAVHILAQYSLWAFITVLYSRWLYQNPEFNYGLAGYIPISDASQYIHGASTLINFGEFRTIEERRPIINLFWAGIALVSNLNLPITIFLTCVVTAISSFLVSVRMYQAYGIWAAWVTLAGLVSFMRYYIGSTLTEYYGLIWGNLSFFFLFGLSEGTRFRNWVLLGFPLMQLGFMGRPGAMFVLPLMILVLLTQLKRLKLKESVKKLSLLGALLVLVMSVNPIVRSIKKIEGTTLSNFALTLYGMAKGGSSWTQYSADYPKDDANITDIVMERTLTLIKANPLDFIKGLLTSLKIYLKSHLYLFPERYLTLEAILVLLAALMCGFILVKDWRAGIAKYHILPIGWLGNFMGALFLCIGVESRVFATTVSYNAGMLGTLFDSSKNEFNEKIYRLLALSLSAFMLVITLYPLFRAPTPPREDEKVTCPNGTEAYRIWALDHTIARVAPSPDNSGIRHVPENYYRASFQQSNFQGKYKFLNSYSAPFYVISGLDVSTKWWVNKIYKNPPVKIQNQISYFCD
jgi:hypothetical protein